MNTFEYLYIKPIGRHPSDPVDVDVLNAASESGWRLFSTVVTPSRNTICIMERPRTVGYELRISQQPLEHQQAANALLDWLDDYATFDEVSAFDRWLHPDEVVPITAAELEAVRGTIRSMPAELVEAIINTFDPTSALVELFTSAKARRPAALPLNTQYPTNTFAV